MCILFLLTLVFLKAETKQKLLHESPCFFWHSLTMVSGSLTICLSSKPEVVFCGLTFQFLPPTCSLGKDGLYLMDCNIVMYSCLEYLICLKTMTEWYGIGYLKYFIKMFLKILLVTSIFPLSEGY